MNIGKKSSMEVEDGDLATFLPPPNIKDFENKARSWKKFLYAKRASRISRIGTIQEKENLVSSKIYFIKIAVY